MLENSLKDGPLVDLLMGRLTQLEEQKDELLVRITYLRELLDEQEAQLKLVRAEEDSIANQLSVTNPVFATAAA